MRVPIYERQVNTVIPEAKVAGPARVVAAPFEEQQNLLRAQNRVAGVVGDIGQALHNHIIERERQKNEAKAEELDTQFRREVQDKLKNPNNERIEVKGQSYERPAGILNRNLEQADGATEEFDKSFYSLREKYLKAAPSEETARRMSSQMNNYYESTRNSVISHESKQREISMVKANTSSLNQQIHDAADISDPQTLGLAVNRAAETSDRIGAILGHDPDTMSKNRKDKAGDIVSKSVTSVLNATGDMNKAQELLDSAKDFIHPDRYEKLQETLATGAERIARQNQLIATQKSIAQEADYLTKLSTGNLSWMNVDNVASDVREGRISDTFGAALTDVLEAKGGYQPTSKQNENYPKFVESIYKATDQKELHGALLDILKNNKDMSQERLAVLINGAMQRSKSLPVEDAERKGPADKKQVEVDAGAQTVVRFGQLYGKDNANISNMYKVYLDEVTAGKSPKEAVDIATVGQVLRDYPDAIKHESPPNTIVNQKTGSKIIFPKFKEGTKVYPTRRYQKEATSKEKTNQGGGGN